MATLYQRLGEKKGISAIVEDVLDFHLKNPAVRPRFENVDREKLHRLAVEFFCMGSGGPEQYTGRDMRTTHSNMNVSEQEFMAVLDDILAALDKHSIDRQTKDEVLGILYSMRDEIVRQ